MYSFQGSREHRPFPVGPHIQGMNTADLLLLCMVTKSLQTIFMYFPLPQFYEDNMQDSSCRHVISIRIDNSVNPDQMASSEAS